MKIFISKNYFLFLEEIYTKKSNDIMDFNKYKFISEILNLLMALPVVTDLTKEECQRIIQLDNDPTHPISFSHRIIVDTIKISFIKYINIDKLDFAKNTSAFYFLTENNFEEISKNYGIVCKGLNYYRLQNFDKYTNAHIKIQKDDFSNISEILPPCNAMIIRDNFIFDPFLAKIDKLKNFILTFKGSSNSFHLTIIYTKDTKNSVNEVQINSAKKTLRTICEFEFIAIPIVDHKKFNINSDRLIFTNYTSGNAGHPFDNKSSVYNQKFLGYGSDYHIIRENYRQYKEDLLAFHNLISFAKSTNTVGYKYDSSEIDFKNRIFNFIS